MDVALCRDETRRVVNATLVGRGKAMLIETEPVNEDQLESHPVYNPVLSSFVTSYGRAHLHRALKQCGTRALYCDTVGSLLPFRPFFTAQHKLRTASSTSRTQAAATVSRLWTSSGCSGAG